MIGVRVCACAEHCEMRQSSTSRISEQPFLVSCAAVRVHLIGRLGRVRVVRGGASRSRERLTRTNLDKERCESLEGSRGAHWAFYLPCW